MKKIILTCLGIIFVGIILYLLYFYYIIPFHKQIPFTSKLIISVNEKILKNGNKPKLNLLLETKKNDKFTCVGLNGKMNIIRNKIKIILDCSYKDQKEGFRLAMAMVIDHLDKEFELPEYYGSFDLEISHLGIKDNYKLEITKDKITLIPQGNIILTTPKSKIFLRIPENSIWMDVGYSDRELFKSIRDQLIQDLKNTGAIQIYPLKGVYASGGFWGLNEANYDPNDKNAFLSGHHNDDFLYFIYKGDINNIIKIVKTYSKYDQSSKGGDYISIAAWTYNGEEIFSWLY